MRHLLIAALALTPLAAHAVQDDFGWAASAFGVTREMNLPGPAPTAAPNDDPMPTCRIAAPMVRVNLGVIYKDEKPIGSQARGDYQVNACKGIVVWSDVNGGLHKDGQLLTGANTAPSALYSRIAFYTGDVAWVAPSGALFKNATYIGSPFSFNMDDMGHITWYDGSGQHAAP